MRKIREMLRLRLSCGQELRAIALSVGGSPSTVHGHLARAKQAGLENWEAIEFLSESELSARLFPRGRARTPAPSAVRAPFECSYVHTELRRVGVTLQLLWGEYCQVSTERGEQPYSYSQFCDRYKAYTKTLQRSMRQVHRAGERAFVDYSGKKPSVYDRETGQVREVELFVLCMGASQYLYAEATWTQKLHDFCGSLIRAFEFLGGTPWVLVPDQLRSAVRGPDRYDPNINKTLLQLSEHYDVTVLPARPRKPKDKAKVENAVLLAQRWILASLRNESFDSLEALNVRIRELCARLNDKPFQRLEGTRRSFFERFDKPELRPLPHERFDIGLWKPARVHVDYHVSLFNRLYSVPHRYVGQLVELRYTQSLVEAYVDNARIASHPRQYGREGARSTDEGHMPEAHRAVGQWTVERVLGWAKTYGEHVGAAVAKLLDSYPRPEFGYRAALGIVRLGEQHGAHALDEACQRALSMTTLAPRRQLLIALMRSARTSEPAPARSSRTLGDHENVRGPDYFECQSIDKETLH